jgi:hypothetical protein
VERGSLFADIADRGLKLFSGRGIGQMDIDFNHFSYGISDDNTSGFYLITI